MTIWSFVIFTTPLAAPRQVRSDKFAPSKPVRKYREWGQGLRLEHPEICQEIMGWDTIKIEFVMPMPRSWTGRKRINMRGSGHKQKPDLDNLVKGFLDAVFYGSGKNDSQFYIINAEKKWGDTGVIRCTKILDTLGVSSYG